MGNNEVVNNYITQLTVVKTRYEEYDKQNKKEIDSFKEEINSVPEATIDYLSANYDVHLQEYKGLDFDSMTQEQFGAIQQSAKRDFAKLREIADKLLEGK